MELHPDEISPEAHLEAYSKYYNICLGKLRAIWRQVGYGAEVNAKFAGAASKATRAWSDAVEQAESERHAIKAQIQQCTIEIANCRAELDDGKETLVDGDSASTVSEGENTLLRSLESLKATLQLWRAKRETRLKAYEALMAVHTTLKQQLGIRHVSVEDPDISTASLEYIAMENASLQEEKLRRLQRVEVQLDALRAICRDLGEDSAEAATEVHPALRMLSADKESQEMLGAVYHLAGADSTFADGELDLSDVTFGRLAAKIGDMERLKIEREAQSRDLLEMLNSLWTALKIPEEAPERSMVVKLLNPDRLQRLHRRTLDKCLAEVNRLECCKAQAMRDLALQKARELEALCISTRIGPPNTGPLLTDLDRAGQMTTVLSKLVRLVAEVQALANKRAAILSQVQDVLTAQADSAWLRQYQTDENRYKGRNASSNMQRAIKAGKMRERLGPMMEQLQVALAEWEVEEGGPFLYDEQVLQDTMLKAVEAELEQLSLERAPRAKPTASGAGGAARPPMGKNAGGAARPPAGNAGAHARPAPVDRPMLTPRNVGEQRRVSLVPVSASSREASVYRSPGGSMSAYKAALARSNDFVPGALRVATPTMSTGGAAPASSQSASMGQMPAATPPRRAAPSPSLMRSEAPGSALCDDASTAMGASGVKNAAQDMFRRVLGDPAEAARLASVKTTGVAASPQPMGKLAFPTMSGALATPGAAFEDDGDDVAQAKCDTPKSTATSRHVALMQQQQAAAGAASKGTLSPQASTASLVSPAAKASRIPRLRL